MASDSKPFYLDLDATQFREFGRAIPLLEDELVVLESYARFARENDTVAFSAARVTDSLLARGQEENLQKLKTLPNVRRLISQTAYPLRDKKFIEIEADGGEILRIKLTDPAVLFLEDYYGQMQSNAALPYPDDEIMRRYLVPENQIEIPVQDLAAGSNHRLKEEKRLIVLRFADVPMPVIVSASTIDILMEVSLMKLKNVIMTAAQNRLGEDLVKDMQNIMPQKSTSIERITHILSHNEAEIPLYFVNLANRLAAYFTIDKDKKGMLTLIQAARIVEAFKGYEAWLESEKSNRDKVRENALKLLNMMADFPALLNRPDIIQKVVKGTSGLEVMASILNASEIETVVQEMLAEFSVFQAEERELLPALLKFRLNDEEFFIHREAVLIFFESERKRVRAELLARFRKMWYALMLKNESRSAMEFDEFFAEDVAKYVKNQEPVFSALLMNPQAIINAFHVISRHPVSTNLQETYFIVGNRVIFKPIHMLLELSRRDIYARVRAELPFLYRYPLLRWLASIFGLIGGNAAPIVAEKEEDPASKGGGALLRDTDWHRILAMVETRLIGEKTAPEMIRKYADLWNIKLGDARKQLAERVENEVTTRAKRLYSMTRKLPEITQSFLGNEIGNAATQIVRKFGNEAADTRALNQYIQLSLIEQLKSIHG
ncbi:MAG: hypothetical protein KF713_10170 [Turneriella sp.]|nr:hypothetical protein [Turneriella sp.]